MLSGAQVEVLVEDLIDLPLDWAIASIEGYSLTTDNINMLVKKDNRVLILGPSLLANGRNCGYSPSTDWSQLGPLISKHPIVIGNHAFGDPEREGQFWGSAHCYASGTTFQTDAGVEVAACRAIVGFRRGATVMVPVELMGK